MNTRYLWLLVLVGCVLVFGGGAWGEVGFDSVGLGVVVGEDGQVASLLDKVNGRECLAGNAGAPLVQIKVGGEIEGLICYGTEDVRLYGKNGRQKKVVRMSGKVPQIARGKHAVVFNCEFEGEPSPVVKVVFKTVGKAELVSK